MDPAIPTAAASAPPRTQEQTTPADHRRHRDGIIARRRAARRDWHAARSRLDTALDALKNATARSGARASLLEAQHAERRARSTYQRTAEETGSQLDRLSRSAGSPSLAG